MPDQNRLNHKKSIQQALTNPESFTTTLLTVVIDEYGTECFSWDPATIVMELEDDFEIQLARTLGDRLMAGIHLMTTDEFYWSLPDFIVLCNVLSGDSYDPRLWDPAEPAEIAWGITEALLLVPPETDEPFAEEIRGYIGAMLDASGIVDPPDVLKIALRDYDPAARVYDYADDPEMFDAIYDLETEKAEEINSILRENLQRLAAQLEGLSLKSGDPSGAVEKMLKAIGPRSSPAAGSII